MTHERPDQDLPDLTIRTFDPADRPAVQRLYAEGLLAGQIDPNDTATDIEDIEAAYFSEPHNHFWVAELAGKVVGMIGVVRDAEQSLGEIRRLRVDPQWQNTSVGATLIEVALAHCKHHGWLKVVLDTRFERNVALDLFSRFGFKHNRSRNVHDREMLEFYLDLYRRDDANDR
ncbi:MAG: GNAT family N-acetyltransferase [Phycisphaeraceae bacterium]|nr:GNAT family N-acetyltransferase [Phycisphaeraceae bacterium]